MTNEFGEDVLFYIWPTDHKDGTPYPADFYSAVSRALRKAGFESETA